MSSTQKLFVEEGPQGVPWPLGFLVFNRNARKAPEGFPRAADRQCLCALARRDEEVGLVDCDIGRRQLNWLAVAAVEVLIGTLGREAQVFTPPPTISGLKRTNEQNVFMAASGKLLVGRSPWPSVGATLIGVRLSAFGHELTLSMSLPGLTGQSSNPCRPVVTGLPGQA